MRILIPGQSGTLLLVFGKVILPCDLVLLIQQGIFPLPQPFHLPGCLRAWGALLGDGSLSYQLLHPFQVVEQQLMLDIQVRRRGPVGPLPVHRLPPRQLPGRGPLGQLGPLPALHPQFLLLVPPLGGGQKVIGADLLLFVRNTPLIALLGELQLCLEAGGIGEGGGLQLPLLCRIGCDSRLPPPGGKRSGGPALGGEVRLHAVLL